jgi:hypothetical protein
MGGVAKRKSGKRHADAGGLNTMSAASNEQYSHRSGGIPDPTESYVEIAPGNEKRSELTLIERAKYALETDLPP